MKKYLLTLLTIFVILAPNVKAEECTNLYPQKPGELKLTLGYNKKDSYFYLPKIELDSSKTYIFYATKDNQLVETLNIIQLTFNEKVYFVNSPISSIVITNSSNIGILSRFYSYGDLTDSDIYKELESWQFWLVEGDTVCIPKTEPDTPNPPVADATLDNFYSIYLDKLGMLVDYTSQNKIILSFIGIILLFVCLEIFLQLFFINGRRRMK